MRPSPAAASSSAIEDICTTAYCGCTYCRPMSRVLALCLQAHLQLPKQDAGCMALLLEQLHLLDPDNTLVWFFTLYPDRPTLLYLGTCRRIPCLSVREELSRHEPVDFDFRHTAPLLPAALQSVPLLPAVTAALDPSASQVLLDPAALRYVGLYNGVFVCNPRTLFAVRLLPPECIYMRPLLDTDRAPLAVPEFLVVRELQALFLPQELRLDAASRDWVTQEIPSWTQRFFGRSHRPFLSAVRHQLRDLDIWLPKFVAFLDNAHYPQPMDEDVLRLHAVLDYEALEHWPRILRSPKYQLCLAKMVLLAMAIAPPQLFY